MPHACGLDSGTSNSTVGLCTGSTAQPTGSQYLHAKTADHDTRHSGKPDTATFMRATGADFSTASSLLYGVVGSNTDYRDWNAIMASGDPVQAARQATGGLQLQYQGRAVDLSQPFKRLTIREAIHAHTDIGAGVDDAAELIAGLRELSHAEVARLMMLEQHGRRTLRIGVQAQRPRLQVAG